MQLSTFVTIGGFEPPLKESKSLVLTTTPNGNYVPHGGLEPPIQVRKTCDLTPCRMRRKRNSHPLLC